MKKFVALTCTLALAASMTVSAAGSPSSYVVVPEIEDAVVATPAPAPVYVAPQAPAVPKVEADAAAYGKTVAEYVSNAVIETPGLPEAAPIAQGGSCVVNGAASNATFTLNPVQSGTTAYALSQAQAVGGTVLNVIDIAAPGVNFNDAEVGFYVAGIQEGDSVSVYKSVKGEWQEVEVLGISNNTVTVKMDSVGIYCFIKK